MGKDEFGHLAVCSQGHVGLILSHGKIDIHYPDGTVGRAHCGIHLSKEKIGQPWSSRKPKFLMKGSAADEQFLKSTILG